MAPGRDESVLSQSAIKITPACHELLKDNRVQSFPFFDILQPFNDLLILTCSYVHVNVADIVRKGFDEHPSFFLSLFLLFDS